MTSQQVMTYSDRHYIMARFENFPKTKAKSLRTDGRTRTKMEWHQSFIANGKTSLEIGSSSDLFGKDRAVCRALRATGGVVLKEWLSRTKDQMYTYVMADGDKEERVVLDLRSGFGRGFYYPSLGMAGQPGWERNPYDGARLNAPFDQVRARRSCTDLPAP